MNGPLAIACARVTMCSATKHGDFLGFSLFSTTLTEADWLTHGLLLLACYGGRCRLRGATAAHCSERVNFVQNKWVSCKLQKILIILVAQTLVLVCKRSCLDIRYHSRFFVQVGHKTTYAAIGNHCFFTNQIILVGLTMTCFSEKFMISYSCIHGFMPNLHKKSWMVSKE